MGNPAQRQARYDVATKIFFGKSSFGRSFIASNDRRRKKSSLCETKKPLVAFSSPGCGFDWFFAPGPRDPKRGRITHSHAVFAAFSVISVPKAEIPGCNALIVLYPRGGGDGRYYNFSKHHIQFVDSIFILKVPLLI